MKGTDRSSLLFCRSLVARIWSISRSRRGFGRIRQHVHVAEGAGNRTANCCRHYVSKSFVVSPRGTTQCNRISVRFEASRPRAIQPNVVLGFAVPGPSDPSRLPSRVHIVGFKLPIVATTTRRCSSHLRLGLRVFPRLDRTRFRRMLELPCSILQSPSVGRSKAFPSSSCRGE